MATNTGTCEICPKKSVVRRTWRHLTARACAEHRQYLAGWMADMRCESESDSRASVRLEREYR